MRSQHQRKITVFGHGQRPRRSQLQRLPLGACRRARSSSRHFPILVVPYANSTAAAGRTEFSGLKLQLEMALYLVLRLSIVSQCGTRRVFDGVYQVTSMKQISVHWPVAANKMPATAACRNVIFEASSPAPAEVGAHWSAFSATTRSPSAACSRRQLVMSAPTVREPRRRCRWISGIGPPLGR
jgi:hypothetical protein